ncbi:MAG TPA: T9SS type A sorting domain-containing protein [Candidatus Marinimicrobia bacterium]|nr:T9SS type A sorting domain-containing protein [Candidatus Neomarinimicrobiota bacterium]
MHRRKTGLFLIALFLLPFISIASDYDLESIQAAIRQSDARWTAGENWVTQLTSEERRMMLGHSMEKPPFAEMLYIDLSRPKSFPVSIDWRNNDGNWVTPVRNQGNCGSCWDFSACAQVESWWKIHNADLDSMPNLSEQFILSCHFTDGCNGGHIGYALDFIMTDGVPSESCLPYQEVDDSSLCDTKCADWESQLMTIPAWGYVTLEEGIIDNIKAAVLRHPVSASFTVYADFYAYSGGVYEHVYGAEEGGHAILIVGWDDELSCWICKNSWGPDWGDNGYFRIKWGDSGLGSYTPFIFESYIEGPTLTTTKDELNFDLRVGDTETQTFFVKNSGTGNLEFSCYDYAIPLVWHIDTAYAYDGKSWWCADPELGGYRNGWLQYLQTPVIDLSASSSPVLTFMTKWAIEDPAGASDGYDGWDGCNVWISTDGGENFSVITPTSPAYTCTDLWSFGHPEQGWNMGLGIPGWAGFSDGWVNAEFDLSAYRTNSVIIRWAFASDQGYSTPDSPELLGFFIDDIAIKDGSTTLFEDYANDQNAMTLSGEGFDVAPWLTLKNSGGMVSPSDSAEVSVIITTRGVKPGEYYGVIRFLSNDSTDTALPTIRCNLTLTAPDHDLSVKDIWLPYPSFFILSKLQFGVEVANEGLNDETDVQVVCTLQDGGTILYCDTSAIDLIATAETGIAMFKPIMFSEPSEFSLTVELINLTDDYNNYNNIADLPLEVGTYIDGFENDYGFWEMEEGWCRSRIIDRHSGAYSAQPNDGSYPYANNLNSSMVFKPGIDLTQVEYATVRYWAIYQIENNKDFAYAEMSSDSVNWITMQTFTGMNETWRQYEINLKPLIDEGAEKAWFRFRFESDSSGGGAGIIIDDVSIYPEAAVAIDPNQTDTSLPKEYELSQNYPNPFNPLTTFNYELPRESNVILSVYDVSGRLVKTLVNQTQAAGYYTVNWDAGRHSSGIYIYRIQAGNFQKTKKCILLK